LDPRKAALQAVVPPWEKREPHYKDALKKARWPDKRLGELEAEARLQKEKLDELRKPKEVYIMLSAFAVDVIVLVD
jgi:hypothetical protein